MSDTVTLRVNGNSISVEAGATVAVAVALATSTCRTSITGEPRGPHSGMGICFECRVSINGKKQCRSCQTICEPGMDVTTND